MKDAKNVFLVGPMGAGKTTVGKFLAQRLNLHFHDSDDEIERNTGASLSWIFDIEGLEGYRNREMKALDHLSKLKNVVVSTGGGCVETPEVREFLKQRGIVVYMEVSLETQLRRLKHDKRRPLLQGDDREDVLIKLWEKREPYYEEIADFTVITDKRSIQDVCEEILNWLNKTQTF